MANKLCDPCLATGLPILPVRYVPVPNSVKLTLPGWAGGQRVTDVDLGPEHHYALRTLRSGYVYLFYARHPLGSNHWECYSVSGDGCLMKQPDARMVLPPMPEFQCSRQGHSNVRLHHLVIEQPDRCGPTWIAFSEHPWSDETLEEYTSNTRLRNARMQTLHPAAMAGGARHSHGTPATEAALNDVIEYSAAFGTDQLPHNTAVGTFSKQDGGFDANRLARQSTRYPWYQRQGQAADAIKSMHERAKKPDGTHHTAHVLALWDAIGMAHELNGYRNDAAGWLKKYGQERELEITALNAIEGVKKALEKNAHDEASDIADNLWRWDSHRSEDRLKNTAGLGAQRRVNEQKLVKLWEQDAAQRVPRGLAQQRSGYVDRSAAEFDAGMKTVDASIARMRANRAADPKYAEHRSQYVQRAVAGAWPKYEERLDRPALDRFKGRWQALLTQADAIIERRTEVLVRWLGAPLFIDALEDFHPNNLADGVLFEDAVGEAIFGMGSSRAGASKIDEWVKEARASVKTNLLWRAVALNQQEGIVEVDAALQVAYGAQVALTSQAWDAIAGQVKWNKVLDLAKKSLTAYNTQAKAANDAASGIKPVGATRGLDKIFLTVGGQWLKPFNWTVDTVNEVMLRTLLTVRSGADPVAAKALGAWDALHSSADRDMLLRRLKNQDHYLSAAAKAQYEEHARKWAALRQDIEIPDAKKQSFNAARDARLALIVAVFEAFNLYKASAKAAKDPGSEKVQAQLTAAQLATSAAAIDVLSNMVKGLAAAGDKALSYQLLKLGGGALSVVASGYGAALDFKDYETFKVAGDYRLATMYLVRSVFQGTSATLTALTALSYCSPLIEAFGKRFGERLAGQALSWAAKRLLLARAALVFASLEVSIFILAVSLIVWYFEDDALQKWCDRCAFGAKRSSLADAYTSADTQMRLFGDALKEAM